MSIRSLRWGSSVVAVAAVFGVALVVPGAATAAVSSGHSGWFWGSPQPQGNTLSGLDFAGTRGYAAGDFGTLLRTDDGGANWAGIDTGLTDPLVRVRVIDPSTVVVGGGCALRRSNDGGQSFSRLPWTASDEGCPSEIASFTFPSADVGYLMTQDGGVFKTADGGQTFSRQTSIPGTSSTGGGQTPTDIFFTASDTGVAVTNGGKLYRTTDSGNSWVDVASSFAALNGVTFVDATTGYAVGAAKALFATADGGQTWSPRPVDGAPFQDFSSIDCADALTCLITEGNGHLARTTDGGATGIEIAPSTGKILAASFSSATRVVAVGERGATVVSDDGGVNYTPQGRAVGGSGFHRLRATSSQIANVGASNGTLVRTVDGGDNWTAIGVPTNADVLDASFPDLSTGFAIDAAGSAFKTVNGGASWQILETGGTQAANGVLAISPANVLLAGPIGIRRSTDGGASFATVSDKDLKKTKLTDIAPAGTAILASGRKALRVSSDGGAGWKKVKLPKKTKVLDASFVGNRKGFILTTKGQLLRTKNAGKSWTDMPAIATGSAYGVSFATASEGFVTIRGLGGEDLGADGLALHTTDGGKSWQPQLISSEAPADLWDAGARAFSLTASGSFFATASGGQAGTASSLSLKQVGGPKSRRAKAGKVKVSGTLSPAEGGEPIVILYRDNRKWRSKTEIAASNGQFTSSFKVKRQTVAVAQWVGDDTRSGAGTKAVKVKPAKKKKPR